MKTAYKISVLLLVSASLVLSYLSFRKENKTAFVTVSKLYNDFQMKKELESKLTNVQQQRKFILDSLEITLKMMYAQIENPVKGIDTNKIKTQFELKREEYLLKKDQFDQDNQAMTQEYTGQITKQLNQYVEEYGKENGYDYIFGADGNGNIMHANEGKDVTSEVSNYINERYKGGAK